MCDIVVITLKMKKLLSKASLLNMKRFYFKLNKVIGMEIRQHPLLERKHLANFKFIIAKGFENKK